MSAGLYLHFPFCKKRCDYCDFVSTTDLDQRKGYLSLLIKEKHLYQKDWDREIFDTIYFGGGTPSLLPPEDWEKLAEWVAKELPGLSEFTIEANPESVTRQFISSVEKTGCTRISLGIQSTDDHVLSCIGRIHTAKQANEAAVLVKNSRIQQVNFDFIVGLPGETREGIETNCQFIETYRPQHISLYFLSLSSSTILFQTQKTNPSLFPDEKRMVEWWKHYIRFFDQLGYQHYEISNFSLPGYESQHNNHYWERDPYLGLGVNASSYLPEKRWTNEPQLKSYRQKLLLAEKPVHQSEILSQESIRFEKIMLGLRKLKTGIPVDIVDQNKHNLLQELLDKQWLKLQNTRLILTENGCLWLDAIIRKLA
ncbi:radical SAM family heme chaperone HemW [bacterium]|nr:radical SAM family heme chaperone HemW [bacterium]